jgi:hypothetical protein
MSHSCNPHPERSPRKKPTKRFFKDLVMPAVGHAKGEVPEEFQPKSDARSARFAVICCAMAVLILASWIGFVQIRKAMRNRAMRDAICCGCGQQQGRAACAKNATCRAPGTGNARCSPDQVASPGSSSPTSRSGSPVEAKRP